MSFMLQLFGICVSFVMLIIVINMIRTRKLQNEYSTIWIFVVAMIFLASIFSNKIIYLTSRIKGEANEVTLLFFAAVFFLLLLIVMSVKLSTQNSQILELSQEIGILEEQIDSLKKDIRRKR